MKKTLWNKKIIPFEKIYVKGGQWGKKWSGFFTPINIQFCFVFCLMVNFQLEIKKTKVSQQGSIVVQPSFDNVNFSCQVDIGTQSKVDIFWRLGIYPYSILKRLLWVAPGGSSHKRVFTLYLEKLWNINPKDQLVGLQQSHDLVILWVSEKLTKSHNLMILCKVEEP